MFLQGLSHVFTPNKNSIQHNIITRSPILVPYSVSIVFDVLLLFCLSNILKPVSFFQYFGAVEVQRMELHILFHGGGKGYPFVWIQNLVDEPQGWLEPRGVPQKGGPIPCRDEATEGHHGLVGITACGGGDFRNGARGGGEICSPMSEHHSPLY